MSKDASSDPSRSLDVDKLRDAMRSAGLSTIFGAGLGAGATDAFADCWFCTSPCTACTGCVARSGC